MNTQRDPYIDVHFGNRQTMTTSDVYQYDHGLKLRIYDFTPENLAQIQYSHAGLSNAMSVIPTKEESCIIADIPDILLMQQKELQCYVYIEDDTSGLTVYEIRIPIRPRSKPCDVSFTPQQIDSYGKQVSELNNAIEEVTGIKSDLTRVTDDATEATEQAKNAADEATLASKKLGTLNLEVESLPATESPKGSIVQTESSTTFNIGIPVSNFAYATFEVDPDDGCLYMKSPDSLTEVTFQLTSDGELCVIV